MAAESNGIVERIKQKLDIVDQIGAVVALKKSGKAFKGLCPFHGERTPSFYVFPETGTWRCFGCNEGGDLFTFVEKQQGLDFREALVFLAERAGIPVVEGSSGISTGEPSADTSIRKRLRALNEAAAIWFHSQLLQAGEAQYARSYLASRGVNNESIALWRLGYAPDGDALARYLQGQGYSVPEIVEAGLARTREADPRRPGGGLYDYFRNRLIFPIRDARGQSTAFGGRELGGGHPKYLNTPQTVLFDKSATLFGLDLARDAIRRHNRVVIVEGYMDAIVPHQYGSRNVVAVIGSAITEKHIQQIKKLTRRVTLALDPDAAGESATLRGIVVAQDAFDRKTEIVLGQQDWAQHLTPDQLHDPGALDRAVAKGYRSILPSTRFEEQVDAEITVARLPAGEDPDEFVRRDPAGWQRAIDGALPLIDFFIEAQTADLALDTPQGKIEAQKRVLPVIAQVRSRTLAGAYADRLAAKLKLDARDLQLELQLTRTRLDREARAKPRASEREAQHAANAADSSTIGDDGVGVKSSHPQHERTTVRYSSSSAAPLPLSTTAMGTAALGAMGGLLFELAQEEYCVGLLIEHPATWMEMRAILDEADFSGTETRALFAAVALALREAGDPSELGLDGFLRQLDPLLRETAEHARGRVHQGSPLDDAMVMRVASKEAYQLKRRRVNRERIEIEYLRREANDASDEEASRTLTERDAHLLAMIKLIDKSSSSSGMSQGRLSGHQRR